MRNLSAVGRLSLVIAAWLFLCVAGHGESREGSYLLGQGTHAYHSGKYAEAQRHLTAAIEGGTLDPRAYYFRGLCRSKLGRTADAEADFLEGSKLEQKFVGHPGEIGQSLQRVQWAIRRTLEEYRSRAREAGPHEQRLAQPQLAGQPAVPNKTAAATLPSPAVQQAAKAQPRVTIAPRPVQSPKQSPPVAPAVEQTAKSQPRVMDPRKQVQAETKSKPGPALVQPAKRVAVEAALEMPEPRVSVRANLVSAAPMTAAPQASEAIKVGKVQSPPPQTSLFGFDMGQALRGLAGQKLPGNMAYVRVSRSYLERVMGEEFREQRPVNDDILGTLYRGSSETVGRTRVRLIPDEHQARIELCFHGQTTFSTSGCTGPVQLFSHGTTWFESCKLLSIDTLGAHFAPAASCAKTCFSTDHIATSLPRLRGRVSVNVAWRRAAQSHAQASSVISRHSERDIGRGFDTAMEKQLTGLREQVDQRLTALPKDHPVIAYGTHCATTADAVVAVLLGPGASDGKFVTAPWLDKHSPDIEVHVHSALVFKAISDPDLQKLLQPFAAPALGGSPKPLDGSSPADGRKPLDIYWSSDGHWLTLIWNAPLSTSTQEPRPSGTTDR